MAEITKEDAVYQTKEDICAHLGDEYQNFMGAIVPPIFQNSLFVRLTESNGVDNQGHNYTRISNPTTDIAERKIAALENAEAGLCFSSGMGAITAAIMHFIRKDAHVVLVRTVYGPARSFITEYLAEKFGVSYTFVRGDSTEEIIRAVRPETALIYLESPSSLIFRIQDLKEIADFAKAKKIGTVIDNSYATPLYQNPIDHGIDLVCHTASKYLGGHSDIVAGAVAGSADRIQSIRDNERAMLGSNMDPHQAWLLIRGIRTLPVRLRQHGESAMKVASFLERHPKVKKIFYPGLDSFEQRELASKYLSGFNGLMSFVPEGKPEQIRKMIGNCKFFQYGVSWGGFESLIVDLTVGQKKEEAEKFDLPADLVRIHVGLENPETLISDLEQAFSFLG